MIACRIDCIVATGEQEDNVRERRWGLCACILHRFHDAIQSSVANFWWTTAADTVDSHLAGVFTFRVWGLYSRPEAKRDDRSRLEFLR